MDFPYLITDNETINTAYRLAIATFSANILPFQDGILTQPEPVIIAGLGYTTPWTRDAAINTWNAGGLLCPKVSLNTLKSVLTPYKNGYRIDGEYWDAIIWVIGAWYQYLFTGDKEFLKMAYNATVQSLEYFENTEFDAQWNLFRGPACYGDGVAAYPDIYAKHGQSGIKVFAEQNRDLCAPVGVGIPMFSLSTNCLYYYAYVLAGKMAHTLGQQELVFADKALAMKNAINQHFWSEEKQNYRYLCDPFGGCDHQEGMGVSFAIMFDVADQEQKLKIFQNQHITAKGIPCVWPTFDRYLTDDHMGYGRHSGTVWPHIQGFWADAAATCKQKSIFDNEFFNQSQNAVNYYQFAEIYHPVTGEIYGGRQERGNGIVEWISQPHQTWSATAYLRNVYMNLVGMQFTEEGITFAPVGSNLVSDISLTNFVYRNATLNICIKGSGNSIQSFKLDGMQADNLIPTELNGVHEIEIILA